MPPREHTDAGTIRFNDPEALLKSIHGGLTFPQDLELDKTAMDAQASLRLFLLASVLPAVWST